MISAFQEGQVSPLPPTLLGHFLCSWRAPNTVTRGGGLALASRHSPGGRERQHVCPCCLLVPSGLPASDRPACVYSLSVSLFNAHHRLCSSGQLFVRLAYYLYSTRVFVPVQCLCLWQPPCVSPFLSCVTPMPVASAFLTTSILVDGSAVHCLLHAGPAVCVAASLFY